MQMNRRQIIKSYASLGLLTTFSLPSFSYSKTQSDLSASECLDSTELYDQFFIDAKGFDMALHTNASLSVFVVFDPQCPDSIHFWKIANSFSNKVRFIWLPVAVLNSRSELQGALILSASNPADMMARQVIQFETSSRGLITDGLQVPSGARDDVWHNSRIFRRAGGKSVPFALFQDRQNKIRGSAQVGTVEALTKFLNKGS
jgi:thiol:disulfide interchange protein DsbG